jgi:hypothetical protein
MAGRLVGETFVTIGNLKLYSAGTSLTLDSAWNANAPRLITFIDLRGDLDWKWLKQLEDSFAVLSSYAMPLAVIYNYNNVSVPPYGTTPTVAWITNRLTAYSIVHNAGFTYAWLDSYGGELANIIAELGGTGALPNPPTFLVDRSYVTTDRWTLPLSASNADSDTGITGSLLNANDLTRFSWPAPENDQLDYARDYVLARVRDLAVSAATPAQLSWDGPNPMPITGGYKLNVCFPGRKVVRGWDNDAYALKNAAGTAMIIAAVSPTGKIPAKDDTSATPIVAGYVGSSPDTATAGEFRTLQTGTLADGSYALVPSTSTGHMLKDLGGVPVGGILSFLINTHPSGPTVDEIFITKLPASTAADQCTNSLTNWIHFGNPSADLASVMVDPGSSGIASPVPGNWVACNGQSSLQITVAAPDGMKTVRLRLRNAAGTVTAVSPATTASIKLDTTAPKIIDVSYHIAWSPIIARVLRISILFSEPVFVTGTPKLEMDWGLHPIAVYKSGSGTETLVFTHWIRRFESLPPASSARITLLSLMEGTVRDCAGNDASWIMPGPICIARIVCTHLVNCRFVIGGCRPAIDVCRTNIVPGCPLSIRPPECHFHIIGCRDRIIPDCFGMIDPDPSQCPTIDPVPFQDLTDILRDAMARGSIKAFDRAIRSKGFKKDMDALPPGMQKALGSMMLEIRKELEGDLKGGSH